MHCPLRELLRNINTKLERLVTCIFFWTIMQTIYYYYYFYGRRFILLRYFTASRLKSCIHIWLFFLNDFFFRNGQSFLFVMTIKEKNDTNKTLRFVSLKNLRCLYERSILKKCKRIASKKDNRNSVLFYSLLLLLYIFSK